MCVHPWGWGGRGGGWKKVETGERVTWGAERQCRMCTWPRKLQAKALFESVRQFLFNRSGMWSVCVESWLRVQASLTKVHFTALGHAFRLRASAQTFRAAHLNEFMRKSVDASASAHARTSRTRLSLCVCACARSRGANLQFKRRVSSRVSILSSLI